MMENKSLLRSIWMSQYNFKVNSNLGEVVVCLGWDEPLQHFFMNIYTDIDDPLYDNLSEEQSFDLSLSHYQQVLDTFGINEISLAPTSSLFEQLMQDKHRIVIKE